MSAPQPSTSGEHLKGRYKKRTDGSGPSSAGDAYEAALHGAVALLAYSSDVAGEQTYEESGLGCLDDLCFKYKDSDGRKLILLQAKHSVAPKNITEVHVKAAYGGNQDDSFSLAKYFMAFLEAKRTAMKNGGTVQQVVLFTNRPLGKGLRQKCRKVKMKKPLQELLNFPNYCDALFYKFPDNFWNVDEVLTANNMTKRRKRDSDELVQWWETKGNVPLGELQKEFDVKLVFAVCQPNVVELQQAEDHLLNNLAICKSMSNECKTMMLKSFRENLKQWMAKRASEGAEELFVSAWTSETTEQCLRKAKARVAQLKIEGLSEANFRLLRNGVGVEVNVSPRFPNEGNVFNTRQLTIYARLAAGTETASQSDCRLLRAEELTEDLHDGFAILMEGMRIIIVHDSQKQSSTVEDIRQKMSNFSSLRTTILTNQRGVGTPLQEVHGPDLSEATLDQIMAKRILFQGHTMKIQDVVGGSHGLSSLLDSIMVELLSWGKTVEIGKDVGSPHEPYMVRHLAEICKSTAEPETGEAPWLRSKTFLEEEIIMEAKKDSKHVIVSAPPGAGKSSLASSMCWRLKEQRLAWWVGKCDLKDKMTALGKYKEKKKSLPGEESRTDSGLTELEYDLLWELLNVEKVEQRLIKDRLVGRTGHVVFVIDSYDEIAHMYGSEFEAFIKPLAELNVCVCVTTREHLLQRAELVLKGHLAFRLLMLDSDEQQDLLVKLWQQNKNGEPESLRSEAENLRRKLPHMFCANPLHLYMISEIDYSSIESSEITLYEMYHKFVGTKFDRYWREAKFDPKTEAEKNNKAMEENLTQIAVWHLLGESHVWNSNEDKTLLLKRVQEKNVGFVFQQDQGHPRFVHESYAEYFLSHQVNERLRSCEEVSDFMVKNRFGQVRRFLDGRLKSDPNLSIPLYVLPPGTKVDFLLNPAMEGLESLSLYVWNYRACFSDETQQRAFNYAVHNCLQPVVEQAIQDRIDVNKPVDGHRALDRGLNGSEMRQLSVLQALISKGYRFHSMTENRGPLLHNFIQNHTFPKVVTLLIEEGCDENAVDNGGETALHCAVQRGNAELVKLLMEKVCNVNAKTRSGETALHIAAEWSNVAVVELLIDKGCDVNAVTQSGETALHKAAAMRGSGDAVGVIKLLIEEGCDVNAVNGYGDTALHKAAMQGDVGVVKLLIEEGCDVKAANGFGETALHNAAMRGHVGVVKLMIEEGCDVNAANGLRDTALHKAAMQGDVGVVKLLIEEGCDVNAANGFGETALHNAAIRGDVGVVTLLIEEGCHLNAANGLGETALHKAAVWGNVAVVELLIKKGCDENAVDNDGETALHGAARSGNVELVKLLIEKVCNVNAKTRSGETALHIAAWWSNVSMVELLIDKGCDVNAVTQSGETALHYAAESGNVEMTNLLIREGCDVNAKTSSGKTALDLAEGKGHIDVVKLLRQELVKAAGAAAGVNSAGM